MLRFSFSFLDQAALICVSSMLRFQNQALFVFRKSYADSSLAGGKIEPVTVKVTSSK